MKSPQWIHLTYPQNDVKSHIKECKKEEKRRSKGEEWEKRHRLCGKKTDLLTCYNRNILYCCYNNKPCAKTLKDLKEGRVPLQLFDQEKIYTEMNNQTICYMVFEIC